jgi:hypothetical protein
MSILMLLIITHIIKLITTVCQRKESSHILNHVEHITTIMFERVKSLTRPTASGFGVSQSPKPAGTALLSGKTTGTTVI